MFHLIYVQYISYFLSYPYAEVILPVQDQPEVANIPPIIPHSRTRNPQKDRRLSSTRTKMEDKSYLKKMPANLMILVSSQPSR